MLLCVSTVIVVPCAKEEFSDHQSPCMKINNNCQVSRVSSVIGFGGIAAYGLVFLTSR